MDRRWSPSTNDARIIDGLPSILTVRVKKNHKYSKHCLIWISGNCRYWLIIMVSGNQEEPRGKHTTIHNDPSQYYTVVKYLHTHTLMRHFVNITQFKGRWWWCSHHFMTNLWIGYVGNFRELSLCRNVSWVCCIHINVYWGHSVHVHWAHEEHLHVDTCCAFHLSRYFLSDW